MVFTDPYIKALRKPGEQRLKDRDGKVYMTAPGRPYKIAEEAPRGDGRLIVRVLPSGTKEFFYRYRPAGEDKTLSLGRYDSSGKNGMTLAQIRDSLRTRRAQQRSTGDVKEHLREQERAKLLATRRGSFGQLLSAYVDSLRAAGKWSAGQVEGIFRRNVLEPFPEIAKAKASEVEPGDIQRILARMVKAGIRRQVNMTRAYLRAAFAFGGKADHDPRTVAADGVLFGLKGNPVTLVPTIKEYERAGERVLDPAELRDYWNGLEALPIAQRATLRLNFALACQRGSQLLRADWPDFDFAGGTLLLRDTKGRGGSRDHLLPLTTFALEQLRPLRELNMQPHADVKSPPFSSDGKKRIVLNTLSNAVGDVSAALTKERGIPRFQARDLRRTAETMLQKLGVDKEVRAHLLSHGRSSGVQGKHYERYDFLTEKRAALEKWAAHLERIITGKSAKVVPMPGRAA